jgi:hypothetical protein
MFPLIPGHRSWWGSFVVHAKEGVAETTRGEIRVKALSLVVPLGWVAALVGFAAASGLVGPAAHAATVPAHFDDGFGLTVISQPAWMDATERTFTFTVRSDQVPAYSMLPADQVSGEHVIMVTLPTGYAAATTRYPVHYTLHGGPEYPQALRNTARLETDRNEHWSAFGTTNVLVHRVSALADMQSGGRVIEAAVDISYGDLMHLPRERRASHLLDMTRGHLQAGQRDQAAVTLLEADQLAPAEVRCRHLAKVVITDLVRSYPCGLTPMASVTRLAQAIGVVM